MSTKADALLLAIVEAKDAEDRYRFKCIAPIKEVTDDVRFNWKTELDKLAALQNKAWNDAREYLAADGYVRRCS